MAFIMNIKFKTLCLFVSNFSIISTHTEYVNNEIENSFITQTNVEENLPPYSETDPNNIESQNISQSTLSRAVSKSNLESGYILIFKILHYSILFLSIATTCFIFTKYILINIFFYCLENSKLNILSFLVISKPMSLAINYKYISIFLDLKFGF